MKFPHKHSNIKNPEVSTSHHKFTHRIWRDPYTDWVIILITALITLVCLVYIGISTFFDIDRKIAEAAKSVKTATVATMDTRSLTKVLDRFDAGAAERGMLLRGYQGLGDPSL